MTDLADRLARFIADQTGSSATVRDLERIPGGFSYETWRFQARWCDGDARLVLRRAPRGGVLEPYDAGREFGVLRALAGSPVPVPRVWWVETTGDVLGTSFSVMEFVEGSIPQPWDESIPEDLRAEMHRQFVDVLAALHTLDWESRGLASLGVPADREDPAATEIARVRDGLARVALRPHPLLGEVLAWLDARRPRCPRLALVHDDYRMGNFVWRDGRIVAILDWERAFIGDPLADVAFTRLENLAGWCAIRGPQAARYTAHSGVVIDPDAVHYYGILEQLKATLVGLTGLKAFAAGRSSDLRLVMIGGVAQDGIHSLAQAIGIAS